MLYQALLLIGFELDSDFTLFGKIIRNYHDHDYLKIEKKNEKEKNQLLINNAIYVFEHESLVQLKKKIQKI